MLTFPSKRSFQQGEVNSMTLFEVFIRDAKLKVEYLDT